MNDENLLERIVLDPGVMVGKPVIKGTRLTVDFILNLFAHGATTQEILDEYQGLTMYEPVFCSRRKRCATQDLFRSMWDCVDR